jgi:hypothetical protein
MPAFRLNDKKKLKEIYTIVHPHVNVVSKDFEMNKNILPTDEAKLYELVDEFSQIFLNERFRHIDLDKKTSKYLIH